MKFKPPKDTKKIKWTNHVKRKMIYYRLSESRVKRVLFSPKRKEKGIVEGTTTAMQPYGSKKKPKEVWVMYQTLKSKKDTGKKVKIITAWRYPGVSPKREPPPVPEDIRRELLKGEIK